MNFLDTAKVYIRSGDGGAGCISFRREKFIEFGGPDGGDGGKGGDVVAEVVSGLNTMIDFRYRQHYKAARGMHGMGSNRTGASGSDVVLRVPIGTQVFDVETDVLLADLTRPESREVLLHGGQGGRGNTRFKTSTNRAPRRADPGEPGQERWIRLQLKLIADAGLVGLPNAGKSTFLSAVTRARPKIADYPFTTLVPMLGVVYLDGEEFVLADIPGLIDGAHAGTGLGHRFLGHVERCRALLHLVDATQTDVVSSWKTVRQELFRYGHGLDAKVEVTALSKADAVGQAELERKRRILEDAAKTPVFPISSTTHRGVPQLLRQLLQAIGPAAQEDEVSRPWTP